MPAHRLHLIALNPSSTDPDQPTGHSAIPSKELPTEYLVSRAGTIEGPLNVDEIRDQLRKGAYQEGDFLWAEGWEEWKPISFLKDRNTPPPPPSTGSHISPDSHKSNTEESRPRFSTAHQSSGSTGASIQIFDIRKLIPANLSYPKLALCSLLGFAVGFAAVRINQPTGKEIIEHRGDEWEKSGGWENLINDMGRN